MTPPLLTLSGIEKDSIVDGPGIRYVVFVQGCPHHCPGCHNPSTHDFAGGYAADMTRILADIDGDPLVSGVTFSGGEPFCQPAPLYALGQQIKARGKHLLIYTGYTLEALQAHPDPAVQKLLALADMLVDGPFIQAQKDLTLRFRGSANQRIFQQVNGIWREE